MKKKMASMEIIDLPATGIDDLSQLPLEIHLLILEKLDYVEFSGFNVVCKAWRSIASAARKSPFFRHQQVPWLIQRVSPGRELPNLSHQKMFYKLELFGLHDSFCFCGSSQGWLLLRQSSTAFRNGGNFLLNPITRQRISLPGNLKSVMKMGVILPRSVVKDDGGGIAVVAYFQHDCCFYQWRSSQDHENWTKIDGIPRIPTISDMIYHKGKIYAIDYAINFNSIVIIDMGSSRPYGYLRPAKNFFSIHKLMPGFIHLVECNGDLLAVVRSHRSYKNKATLKVSVFKYNLIDKWEKVESIGEKYALLVGKGNNMAIDVSTNSATSFRANCVYFLEYDSAQGQGIRSFDLGKNRLGIFVPYAWYARITSNADPPTWFMPSLT